MARSSTTFGKDNQPNRYRGKDKKRLILDAMKEKMLLGVTDTSTVDECEQALFGHILEQAVISEDASTRNACMSIVVERGWAKLKPSTESYEFDYDPKADKSTQANQIMAAVAQGVIPADIGISLIGALANVMKLVELDEFERRLKALEQTKDDEA